MSKKRDEKDSIISNFSSLDKEEKIDLLASLVLSLKDDPKQSVPVEIFDNDKLSVFEALVKYLKENKGFRFVEIATILKRSDKTIWTTYSKAKKKYPTPIKISGSKYNIPLTKFSDRRFTIFESVVAHLKDLGLTNHKIGVMLHRDDRTIWSIYDRVKKKKEVKNA